MTEVNNDLALIDQTNNTSVVPLRALDLQREKQGFSFLFWIHSTANKSIPQVRQEGYLTGFKDTFPFPPVLYTSRSSSFSLYLKWIENGEQKMLCDSLKKCLGFVAYVDFKSPVFLLNQKTVILRTSGYHSKRLE